MSGIPTNIITVEFPDGGGDPARGGSSADADLKAVVETLKHIQVSVGAINSNVRAILETLRKISTGKGMTSPAPAASAARSERVRVERVFRVDPSKAIVVRGAAAGFPDFEMSDGGPVVSPERGAANRRRRAQGLARISSLPPGTPVIDVPNPISVYQEQAERLGWARSRRVPLLSGATSSSASGVPVPGMPAPGVPGMPVPGVLAPPAPPVPPGPPRPSPGLPAPSPRPPAPPGPPAPPAPPGTPSGPGGLAPFLAGIRQILTPIGQIMSIIRLGIGFLKSIFDAMQKIVGYARDQRASLAGVDPMFARMQAQMTVAGIQDRIMMAKDPLVRGAAAAMTQSELAMIAGTQRFRADLTAGAMFTSSAFFDELGALGFAYKGIREMNPKNIMAGAIGFLQANSIVGALVSANYPGIAAINLLSDMAKLMGYDLNSYVKSQNFAQMKADSFAIFQGDLQSMTAGRFDISSPYPAGTGSRNWWKGRR